MGPEATVGYSLPHFGWSEEEVELVSQMKQLKSIYFLQRHVLKFGLKAPKAMVDRLRRALPDTKIFCTTE